MAERIDNLWETLVVPNILEQYSKITLSSAEIQELGCDNRWQAVIKSTVEKLQNVENGIFVLSYFFDIPSDYDPEEITSERLEYLAGLMNVFRESGETDEDLFERFIESLHTNDAGTPPNVIRNAVRMSGDGEAIFFDHESEPAKFFVYTPNGTQIKQSKVRKLAAAGVLGMAGAALMFEDNTAVCAEGGTAGSPTAGDIFLVAADDGNA